jgi:hypothetical protein
MAKTAAWTRKEGKDPKGGLNAKGVASYRKENPGSKLQTAVTTKPSKLKAGSKDAKRRKSFCARMSGMPGPMKKPNGRTYKKKISIRQMELLKRKDGSTSRRGLWDNIRENKGSGKKPTKAMLSEAKKIKAKTKKK